MATGIEPLNSEIEQVVTEIDAVSRAGCASRVTAEVARTRAFEALRQRLLLECGASGGGAPRYPSMAFERWWYSAQYGAEVGATAEPLLPSAARPDDATLLSDLAQVGFGADEAGQVATRLAKVATAAAASVPSPLATQVKPSKSSTCASPANVTVSRNESGNIELHWNPTRDDNRHGSVSSAHAVLTSEAFAKMRALHSLHARCGDPFEPAALVVAMRYRSLGGGGFQLALPSAAFRVLADEFGVVAECFASPLNCYFGHYCSAFPDCDAPFGSLGSFFDFKPRRGAFEANPPFAPTVLKRMREHMHVLLKEATGALSFIVAVANWDHAEVAALRTSPWARAHLIVSPDEQRWLEGSKARRAPVELLVLVLQNDAATRDKRLAATKEKLASLKHSCTGEAAALGPRKPSKRPKLAVDTDVVGVVSQVDAAGTSTRDAATAGDASCETERLPVRQASLPRTPMWRLRKMLRLAQWSKIRVASNAFAWTPEVVNGWHQRNMLFWGDEPANVDGMTGGGVSEKDLLFSEPLLQKLATRCGSADGGRFARALDVGAGIGRVSQALLAHWCDRIDLLEPVQKHLDKARQQLGGPSWPGEFRLGTLQTLPTPPADERYDLVWCQWLLMYITDADVLAFLRKAGEELLAPAGILVVKENIAQKAIGTYFDDKEGELWTPPAVNSKATETPAERGPVSVVRTQTHYESLFQQAGLTMLFAKPQRFSNEDMPMVFFALFRQGSST
eukprot:TRINITY_DN68211_c0_g1_i1.p1 TRINITY_DN68211_c0_g1~~TRINITY_DN68211_c0_g1_i1.p1  ORF type:complete len:796 (-),score=131.25 TRINITY_DN68211_c0_g1_i1:29-2239(-)